MKSKHLLAAALLLPFATISKAANVDQMCGRWQKATRQAEQRAPNAYLSRADGHRPTSDLGLQALHVSRWA
jgi:hypothetical protein